MAVIEIPLKNNKNKNISISESVLEQYHSLSSLFPFKENAKKEADVYLRTRTLKAECDLTDEKLSVFDIEAIINNSSSAIDDKTKIKVLLFNKAFEYIMQNPNISHDTIANLYSVVAPKFGLSPKLFGQYYRACTPKYFYSDNPQPSDKIHANVMSRMDSILEFIHNNSLDNVLLESIIMEIYLRYLMPFYNDYGLTSRILANWNIYSQGEYDALIVGPAFYIMRKRVNNAIQQIDNQANFDAYLNRMQEILREQFFAQQKVEQINSEISLNTMERLIVEYMITHPDMISYKDFYDFFSITNAIPKKAFEENIIIPLAEKGVIEYRGQDHGKTNILQLKK